MGCFVGFHFPFVDSAAPSDLEAIDADADASILTLIN